MNDARAWLVWVLTVLLTASYSRNPLYGILLLLVTLWANVACSVTDERGMPLGSVRFALFAIPAAAVFNALAVHVGETVLFYLPDWLPLVGGAITGEALVFGALNGLSLVTIYSGFLALNRALPVRQLIKLTPRAFHESGVVLSIALTFVPQTMHSLERIREAQAVRGHRLRGLRDWLPVVTPLLVGALERAFTLAEAMMARGYAAVATAAQLPVQTLLAVGLLTLLGGWLGYLFLPTFHTLSVVALGLGGFLLLTALVIVGRSSRHTVYQPQHWRLRDTAIVIGCVPILIMLLWRQETFYYTSYPRLTWPTFDLWVGCCILGLLVPAWVSNPVPAKDLHDSS